MQDPVERLTAYLENSFLELKPPKNTPPKLAISSSEIAERFRLSSELVAEIVLSFAETRGLDAEIKEGAKGATITISSLHGAHPEQVVSTRAAWKALLAEPGKMQEYVERFLPMAHQICCAMAKRKAIRDFDQLEQHARVALLFLLGRYNPEKGPLPQFLQTYLPKEIATVFRSEQSLRTTLHRRAREIDEIREELLQRGEYGEDALLETAAQKLGLSTARVASSIGAIAAAQARSRESADGYNVLDDYAHALSPEGSEVVQEFLLKLPVMERRILELKMMGVSLADIGYIFSLSGTSIHNKVAAIRTFATEPSSFPSQSIGLGYGVLRREQEVLNQIPKSWSELLPYVDGLTFFLLLRRFQAPWSEPLLAHITGGTGSYAYDSLPSESQAHMRNLIRTLNPNINRLRLHPLYEEILGLSAEKRWSPSAIVAACMRRKIFDWMIPVYESFASSEHGGGRNKYFIAEVVGSEKRVTVNRKLFVRNNFSNLDEITQGAPGVQGLAALLNVGGSRRALARRLVELGDLSPQRPQGLPPWRACTAALSFYLDEDVVGASWARKNFNDYFLETYPHVDAVTESKLLLLFLGKEGTAAEDFARAAQKLVPELSVLRPVGYSLAHHGVERSRVLSFFYDSAVVPLEIARQNLKSWVEERKLGTADLSSKLLARAINLTRLEGEPEVPESPVNRSASREALRARGWI